METIDVLICGAGAAGLTLAIDLARRGVDFRLIDAAAQPFHGSRGKGMQPRTLEVFEDLGVVDRMVAAGGPYPPQRAHRDDGSSEDFALHGDQRSDAARALSHPADAAAAQDRGDPARATGRTRPAACCTATHWKASAG